MSAPGIDAKVAYLARPETYPDAPRAVEVVETHMSWVFLTDHHAYKLKKPVRYDSLDFSTPALRWRDCEEEVRLNRRLARDVYLGVATLGWDPDRGLALDGRGEPIDWLVWMRRLPADQMLDERIRCAAIERADVHGAALALAKFYAEAPPSGLSAAAYREHLDEGVRSDRRELCRPEFGLESEQVNAIAGAQLAFLERRAELFDQHVRDGRIVEGHGDLRPEHICLVPEPAIIDCLEFSRKLRLVDPADELAFLALECERLGNPAVGRWFLEVYSEVSGDAPPAPLLRFHRTYRALRRATIAAWHLQDPSVRDRAGWRERAQWYLDRFTPGRVFTGARGSALEQLDS
jgi:aminoglycoside phosphotransferase family enzyme